MTTPNEEYLIQKAGRLREAFGFLVRLRDSHNQRGSDGPCSCEVCRAYDDAMYLYPDSLDPVWPPTITAAGGGR